MSKTFFISDVHLSEDKPEITDKFINFLHYEAIKCNALYILGDLFEIWIGDDYSNHLCEIISNKLRELSIPIFFIHGNRDFLLSKNFADKSGMIILSEEHILNIYGLKILVMHGDILCAKDKIYQIFRQIMRSYFLQQVFLSFPLYIRKYVASYFRKKSKKYNLQKPMVLISVDANAVNNIMLNKQVQILIHGHVHDPKIFSMHINNQKLQRVVLGSWDGKHNVLQFNQNGLKLMTFPK